MNTQQVITKLRSQGIHLEVKLKASGQKPDAPTLELLKAHKPNLITHLTHKDSIPRLPWQLERLIAAASDGLLLFNVRGVPDVNHYVMAWGCSYLTSDKEEALSRLWQVYHQWQEVN